MFPIFGLEGGCMPHGLGNWAHFSTAILFIESDSIYIKGWASWVVGEPLQVKDGKGLEKIIMTNIYVALTVCQVLFYMLYSYYLSVPATNSNATRNLIGHLPRYQNMAYGSHFPSLASLIYFLPLTCFSGPLISKGDQEIVGT
jgi:hypothetical protein